MVNESYELVRAAKTRLYTLLLLSTVQWLDKPKKLRIRLYSNLSPKLWNFLRANPALPRSEYRPHTLKSFRCPEPLSRLEKPWHLHGRILTIFRTIALGGYRPIKPRETYNAPRWTQTHKSQKRVVVMPRTKEEVLRPGNASVLSVFSRSKKLLRGLHSDAECCMRRAVYMYCSM